MILDITTPTITLTPEQATFGFIVGFVFLLGLGVWGGRGR